MVHSRRSIVVGFTAGAGGDNDITMGHKNMPGTFLKNLQVGAMMMPIFQIRRSRLRKSKEYVQSHRARGVFTNSAKHSEQARDSFFSNNKDSKAGSLRHSQLLPAHILRDRTDTLLKEHNGKVTVQVFVPGSFLCQLA